MKHIPFLFVFFFLLSFNSCCQDGVEVKKDDKIDLSDNKQDLSNEKAKITFDYLNEVRSNPNAKSGEYSIDLSSVKSIFPLLWNETLADIAFEKAKDMATRGYFDHVDPDGSGINKRMNDGGYLLAKHFLMSEDQNSFELIIGGPAFSSGGVLIKDLIVGSPSHIKQLLGMSDFFALCVECGIGFYSDPSSPLINYTCIIIARRK